MSDLRGSGLCEAISEIYHRGGFRRTAFAISYRDHSHSNHTLLCLFCIISVTMLLFSLGANLVTSHLGLNAGIALHERMMKRVVRAPMSFFDSTPLGRIQNRFSADTAEADNATQFALALLLGAMYNDDGGSGSGKSYLILSDL